MENSEEVIYWRTNSQVKLRVAEHAFELNRNLTEVLDEIVNSHYEGRKFQLEPRKIKIIRDPLDSKKERIKELKSRRRSKRAIKK